MVPDQLIENIYISVVVQLLPGHVFMARSATGQKFGINPSRYLHITWRWFEPTLSPRHVFPQVRLNIFNEALMTRPFDFCCLAGCLEHQADPLTLTKKNLFYLANEQQKGNDSIFVNAGKLKWKKGEQKITTQTKGWKGNNHFVEIMFQTLMWAEPQCLGIQSFFETSQQIQLQFSIFIQLHNKEMLVSWERLISNISTEWTTNETLLNSPSIVVNSVPWDRGSKRGREKSGLEADAGRPVIHSSIQAARQTACPVTVHPPSQGG